MSKGTKDSSTTANKWPSTCSHPQRRDWQHSQHSQQPPTKSNTLHTSSKWRQGSYWFSKSLRKILYFFHFHFRHLHLENLHQHWLRHTLRMHGDCCYLQRHRLCRWESPLLRLRFLWHDHCIADIVSSVNNTVSRVREWLIGDKFSKIAQCNACIYINMICQKVLTLLRLQHDEQYENIRSMPVQSM